MRWRNDFKKTCWKALRQNKIDEIHAKPFRIINDVSIELGFKDIFNCQFLNMFLFYHCEIERSWRGIQQNYYKIKGDRLVKNSDYWDL